MRQPPDGMRTCPTREDGAEVLIAHAVTGDMCAKRQACGYHKCYSCVHNERRERVLPAPPAAQDLELRPEPRRAVAAPREGERPLKLRAV